MTMSLRSNSVKSVSKSCSSDVQFNEEMLELSQTVSTCIAQDLPLLRPHIDCSQLAHPMPDLKKTPKNQTISESQIISRLDQINAELNELNDENKCEDNGKDSALDLGLDPLLEAQNRLKISFPTFKRLVNSFEDRYRKRSIDGLDDKVIDVNEENVDKMLRMSQQIQHFQQTDRHLKSFNDI